MRISTKRLASIIKEAVSSELDIKSMSDADIMSLKSRFDLELKDRQRAARRSNFTSLQKAAEYLQDVALGFEIYDEDKVQDAEEFMSKNSLVSSDIAAEQLVLIDRLVGSMSNVAADIEARGDDYESDQLQQEQNKNNKKLEALMTKLAFKFDKGFVKTK